jgi:hypothetical protein
MFEFLGIELTRPLETAEQVEALIL